MAVQTLYRAQAFGPGASMWIVPDEVSPLVRKIDWYLNFQLSKAQHHKTEHLAPQLRTLLNENHLQILAHEEEKSETPKALMMAAGRSFPTQTIVEVPAQKSKKDWVHAIHEIWRGMDRPPLRVFLPSNITAEDFKSLWGASNEDLTVVPF